MKSLSKIFTQDGFIFLGLVSISILSFLVGIAQWSFALVLIGIIAGFVSVFYGIFFFINFIKELDKI